MTVKAVFGSVAVITLLAVPVVTNAQHEGMAHPTAAKPNQAMPMQGDAGYVDMMMMHHDQGIEMAKAVVEKGQREDVKAFASKIISGQQEEKKELESYKATLAAGTSGSGGGHEMAGMKDMKGMHDMKDMPEMKKGQQDIKRLQAASSAEADRLFLAAMAQHHQQAVQMSRKAKPTLKDAKVRAFADRTITKQTQEIGEIKKLQAEKAK